MTMMMRWSTWPPWRRSPHHLRSCCCSSCDSCCCCCCCCCSRPRPLRRRRLCPQWACVALADAAGAGLRPSCAHRPPRHHQQQQHRPPHHHSQQQQQQQQQSERRPRRSRPPALPPAAAAPPPPAHPHCQQPCPCHSPLLPAHLQPQRRLCPHHGRRRPRRSRPSPLRQWSTRLSLD